MLDHLPTDPSRVTAAADLPRVLAEHPDGAEVLEHVATMLARWVQIENLAMQPPQQPKPAPFLDGCRQIDGTWIHGRPHSCPKWTR